MGTSPQVKTKRKPLTVITAGNGVGKSIFNGLFTNVTESVWVDEVDHSTAQPYPRNETIKYNADPLALILSFRDQGIENWKIAEKIMEKSTQELLVQKSYVSHSEEIKRYYRNRFMISALKNTGQNMSRFRQDLYNFVDSQDPYTIYKNDIPMIVKLPDFYNEDVFMDSMVKRYKMSDNDYRRNCSETVTLYPIRRVHRKTKRSDQFYYWFRDDSQLVYRLNLDPKNTLLHLFEREFSQKSVNIAGTFFATHVRGQPYTFYSMNNWKIL